MFSSRDTQALGYFITKEPLWDCSTKSDVVFAEPNGWWMLVQFPSRKAEGRNARKGEVVIDRGRPRRKGAEMGKREVFPIKRGRETSEERERIFDISLISDCVPRFSGFCEEVTNLFDCQTGPPSRRIQIFKIGE